MPFATADQRPPYTLNTNQRRILMLAHQHRSPGVTLDRLCELIGCFRTTDRQRIARSVEALRGAFIVPGPDDEPFRLTARAEEIVSNIQAAVN